MKTQVFQFSLTPFFFIKVNFSIEHSEGQIMFISMSKMMMAHKCGSVQISLVVVQNYAENSIPFHPGGVQHSEKMFLEDNVGTPRSNLI